MNGNRLLVLAAGAVVALGIAVWVNLEAPPTLPTAVEPLERPGTAASGTSAMPGTPQRQPSGALTTGATAIQPWTLADASTKEAPPKLRDDLPGQLVRLDRAKLVQLAAGDTLTLPLADAISQTATISEVRERAEYAVTSFKGSTTGAIALPVVITLGEEAVFATISTTSGVFELRGRNDMAWIYRASDLTPPGSEDAIDYVIPQEEEPQ